MADSKPFDLKRHLPSMAFVAVFLVLIAAFGGIFIYAGVYSIGADSPHSRLVYNLLQDLRQNAVARGAQGIAVPKDLNDPRRIAAGAGLYQEMCTGCHLGPGLERTEMSQGLYPPAPELARGDDLSPAEQFWTIKHGVKLTAMPAWGKTHNDELIWDMVAFIRQMPKMSPEQYKATVASAPEDHEELMKGMETDEKDRVAKAPAETLPHEHPATEEHHR